MIKRIIGIVLVAVSLAALVAAPAAAKPGKNHDDKYSEYSFTFVNGVTIAGRADKNDVTVAGGDSGSMTLHVSCSDIFTNGWASKGSPTPADGAGWQVSSYHIDKYKKGELHKSCGEFFVPPTTTTVVPTTTTEGPRTTTTTEGPRTTTTTTPRSTTTAPVTTTTIVTTTTAPSPTTTVVVPTTTTLVRWLPRCLYPGQPDPRGPQDYSHGIPAARPAIAWCGTPTFTG